MTRHDIIEGIKAYVDRHYLNKTDLYTKEGVEILLNYFEEKITEMENERNTIIFNNLGDD